jgi:hypothetical protein
MILRNSLDALGTEENLELLRQYRMLIEKEASIVCSLQTDPLNDEEKEEANELLESVRAATATTEELCKSRGLESEANRHQEEVLSAMRQALEEYVPAVATTQPKKSTPTMSPDAVAIEEIRESMNQRASAAERSARLRDRARAQASRDVQRPPGAVSAARKRLDAQLDQQQRWGQTRHSATGTSAKVPSISATSNDLLPLTGNEGSILGMGLQPGLARDASELMQIGLASAFMSMSQHFWHKTLGGHNIFQLLFQWARGPELHIEE